MTTLIDYVLVSDLEQQLRQERKAAETAAIANLTQGLCRDLVNVLNRQFPGRRFRVQIESLGAPTNG